MSSRARRSVASQLIGSGREKAHSLACLPCHLEVLDQVLGVESVARKVSTGEKSTENLVY